MFPDAKNKTPTCTPCTLGAERRGRWAINAVFENNTEKSGLYVHLPFCRSRCGYCGFVSTGGLAERPDLHRRYVSAVLKELERRLARDCRGLVFDTLYLGGGTPSVLGEGELRTLLGGIGDFVPMGRMTEISFEANPEDLAARPELPGLLSGLGVNRVSVGIQTLDPGGLAALGRKAEAATAAALVERLHRLFSGAIGLDLILGWPGQDGESLRRFDLPLVAGGGFEHLSVYGLTLEPDTPLELAVKRGKLRLPDEDGDALLWDLLEAGAAEAGLEHYEISNFCAPGHACLHNSNTWKGMPYLGVGCAAVSRPGRARWRNLRDLEAYLAAVEGGAWPVEEAEFLTEEIRWKEELMLSLRTASGLDAAGFAVRHGFDPLDAAGYRLRSWLDGGLLTIKGPSGHGALCLTPAGWRVYNSVVSDWMLEIERKAEGG